MRIGFVVCAEDPHRRDRRPRELRRSFDPDDPANQDRIRTLEATGLATARSSGVPRSDTPRPFGAKHPTCHHWAVRVPHDGSLAVWTAERGTLIRCSDPETLPEERRGLNRSPPTRSRTRPRSVSSDAAWPVSDSGPALYARHPRLVNAYADGGSPGYRGPGLCPAAVPTRAGSPGHVGAGDGAYPSRLRRSEIAVKWAAAVRPGGGQTVRKP